MRNLNYLYRLLIGLFILVIILITIISVLIYYNEQDYIQLLISTLIVTGSLNVATFLYFLEQKNKRKNLKEALTKFLKKLHDDINSKEHKIKSLVDVERESKILFSRNLFSYAINSGYMNTVIFDLIEFQSKFDFYYSFIDMLLKDNDDTSTETFILDSENESLTKEIDCLLKKIEAINIYA